MPLSCVTISKEQLPLRENPRAGLNRTLTMNRPFSIGSFRVLLPCIAVCLSPKVWADSAADVSASEEEVPGAPSPDAPSPSSPSPDAPSEVSEASSAKGFYDRGLDLVRQERCEEAIEAFERAYAVQPHHAPLLNMSLCYERLGDLDRAIDYLRQHLEEGGERIPPDTRESRQAHLHSLEARLQVERGPGEQASTPATKAEATLSVHCAVPGAVLRVDGQVVATSPFPRTIPLTAGEHLVAFSREGYQPDRRQLTVAGQPIALSCRLQPLDTPSTEAEQGVTDGSGRLVGSIVGGTGIALIGVGAGLAIWNSNEAERWKREDDRLQSYRACVPDCDPAPPEDFEQRQLDNNDLSDEIRNTERLWIALGAAGVGLVAVGSYLVFTDEEAPADASLHLGPASIHISGTW
jgi:hypothetical protein